MTWQSIDNDTYIDDTLVTCAEYQLFIDDERIMGRYYQPDHWTSYEFPEGKAREPILGVRPNDVEIFCYWLEKHGKKNWSYRLPTFSEATQHPVLMLQQEPLGYWTKKNDNEGFQFCWMSMVSLFSDFEDALDHASVLITTHFNSEVSIAVQAAKAIALERTLNLAQDISVVREHMLDLGLDTKRVNHVLEELESNLDRNLKHPQELSLIAAKANALVDEIETELEIFLNIRRGMRDQTHYGSIRQAYKWILNLAVDIVILDERIAGRSPAFEGIRLVKERIK